MQIMEFNTQNNKTDVKDLLEWLRDYSKTRINSRLIDERRCIPPYIVLDLGNHGLLGMQVSPQYGGINLNNRDMLRVLQQLGAIDPTLASFVGVHNVLGTRPIANYASEAVKEELLPSIATGRKLAAFALTEPGAGSNPQAISARAMPDRETQWQLSGTKIWIGSAAWASVINTFVKTFDDKGQYLGISGFAIHQDGTGLRQGPESLTMGLRGMVQNTVYLDNVRVGSEYLLGKVGTGMKAAQDAMMHGRLCISAVSLGGMKRCAQLMLRYAKRRNISTGRLVDNPVTLVKLTDLTESIVALESLIDRIATLLDSGQSIPIEAYAVCKISAPEFFWKAADNLIQILGGRGYIETNIAPQFLRDSRVLRIYEGPTETLNMFLGSKINHRAEEFYEFICEELNAPKVADALKFAVNEIRDFYNTESYFLNKNSSNRWLNICIGEIVTLGTLWAAVEGLYKQSGSQRLYRTAIWSKLHFEQKLKVVLSGFPANIAINKADILDEIISSYSDEVGEIEQTLSGELHDLDEMLYPSC